MRIIPGTMLEQGTCSRYSIPAHHGHNAVSYNIQYDRFTARVNQVEQEGRVLWWSEWDYYVTCRGTTGESSIARGRFPS